MTARTAMRSLPFWALLAVVACKSTGSGDDTDTDVTTDTDAAAPQVDGAWKVTAGGQEFAWLFPEAGAALAHLELTDGGKGSGTVALFGGDPSGQLDCHDAVWGRVTDGSLIVSDPQQFDATSRLLLLSFPDADTLELTDEGGRVLRAEREAQVPSEAVCGTATLADSVTVDSQFSHSANLVWDGVALRFPVNDGATQILDLTTGALSDPWDFGWDQFQLPVTTQDGVPWITCGCGANQEIHLTQDGGTVLDAVDTRDLGHGVHLRGAVVTDDDRLWLYGPGMDDTHTWFLSVDTSSEPDLIVAEVQTTARLRQLARLGADVYALGYRSVLRVDLASGRVLDTWKVDGLSGFEDVVGLTADGAKLWVAVGDGSETTVVASLVLP